MEATANSKDEVIKRDICQIISRGTYVDIPNGKYFVNINKFVNFNKFYVRLRVCFKIYASFTRKTS